MHFSKVLLPFLAALALAQDTDNDNDDDNNDVANSAPNTPAVGDGSCHAIPMECAKLNSRAASLKTSIMPGSTNAAGTGDNDDDNDDDNNASSSMSPTMNMMSSSTSSFADTQST